MNYYQDLTLLSDLNISLGFLWHKVYQQVHIALVEQKVDDQHSAMAVGFPEYGCQKFPLGSNYAAQIHNSILQVLLEFGLIGLILVFCVFLRIFFDLRKIKINKMNIFYIAIVTNVFISSLFNGGAYYVVTLSLFCIFFAILYSEKYQLNVKVK